MGLFCHAPLALDGASKDAFPFVAELLQIGRRRPSLQLLSPRAGELPPCLLELFTSRRDFDEPQALVPMNDAVEARDTKAAPTIRAAGAQRWQLFALLQLREQSQPAQTLDLSTQAFEVEVNS